MTSQSSRTHPRWALWGLFGAFLWLGLFGGGLWVGGGAVAYVSPGSCDPYPQCINHNATDNAMEWYPCQGTYEDPIFTWANCAGSSSGSGSCDPNGLQTCWRACGADNATNDCGQAAYFAQCQPGCQSNNVCTPNGTLTMTLVSCGGSCHEGVWQQYNSCGSKNGGEYDSYASSCTTGCSTACTPTVSLTGCASCGVGNFESTGCGSTTYYQQSTSQCTGSYWCPSSSSTPPSSSTSPTSSTCTAPGSTSSTTTGSFVATRCTGSCTTTGCTGAGQATGYIPTTTTTCAWSCPGPTESCTASQGSYAAAGTTAACQQTVHYVSCTEYKPGFVNEQYCLTSPTTGDPTQCGPVFSTYNTYVCPIPTPVN